MARLSNSFEGGTDGTAVSTANSGGASGNAWDEINLSGGETFVFDDDEFAAGAFSGLFGVTTSGTSIARWNGATSWGTKTEVWARFYFRISDSSPTNNMDILRFNTTGGTNTANLQMRSNTLLALRDSSSTLRYATSTAISANTWYRVETHIVHSTTAGHMELRLFHGANLHGTTPDESIGNLTDNWNTGASHLDVFFGAVSNPGQTISVWMDEIAVDDTDWIGPVTQPRRYQVAWAEFEVPDAVRRYQLAWAEFEVPGLERRYRLSWAEMEIPSADRRYYMAWAEFETPNAPKRYQLSWAELEVPSLPPRRYQMSWAELEVPTTPKRYYLSWAEFELPNAPRRYQLSWAEFEVPNAPRRYRLAWAEFEVPNAPKRYYLSWAELEIADLQRRYLLSWAEYEVPNVAADSTPTYAWRGLPRIG